MHEKLILRKTLQGWFSVPTAGNPSESSTSWSSGQSNELFPSLKTSLPPITDPLLPTGEVHSPVPPIRKGRRKLTLGPSVQPSAPPEWVNPPEYSTLPTSRDFSSSVAHPFQFQVPTFSRNNSVEFTSKPLPSKKKQPFLVTLPEEVLFNPEEEEAFLNPAEEEAPQPVANPAPYFPFCPDIHFKVIEIKSTDLAEPPQLVETEQVIKREFIFNTPLRTPSSSRRQITGSKGSVKKEVKVDPSPADSPVSRPESSRPVHRPSLGLFEQAFKTLKEHTWWKPPPVTSTVVQPASPITWHTPTSSKASGTKSTSKASGFKSPSKASGSTSPSKATTPPPRPPTPPPRPLTPPPLIVSKIFAKKKRTTIAIPATMTNPTHYLPPFSQIDVQFDGRTSIKEFLQRYELLAISYGWSEADKLRFFP
ncbi:SH3-containing GRB2-like protein 3-interacting protein 1 [Folsomia candida]|uniref:Uncharacterized protein n=1 Tax=Folsomia candida TaxID=158441 RepID=A0A226DUZ6_FOLCA|nr:SH3-containing GRB2-like protein 3-interacting protein 1 [Folsomia candida]OXA48848.1 hypothetical protein Fcan01_16154 [Folsomia candida]